MSDPRLRELPQEGLTLVRPSTSHLATEHHQPGAAVGSRELGVGGFFTSPCTGQCSSVHSGALRSRSSITPDRGDHRCVDGKLRAMEQRQPIHDHFKSGPQLHEVASPGHQPAHSVRHGPPPLCTPELPRSPTFREGVRFELHIEFRVVSVRVRMFVWMDACICAFQALALEPRGDVSKSRVLMRQAYDSWQDQQTTVQWDRCQRGELCV